MNRRTLLCGTTGLLPLVYAGRKANGKPIADQETSQSEVLMKVGSQLGPTTELNLRYLKRLGVNHICGYPTLTKNRGFWTLEDLERILELCDRCGISLDLVALPFLSSSHIDREKRGAILLADDPERERDLEQIQIMIANCAKVGIPAIKYNLSLLGVLRTNPTPGRGGSLYSTWKLSEAVPVKPLTRAGRVTEEMAWERITFFLDRIIPVCNEYRIRMACHPHDPGVPPAGYQGISRVLGTVAGLKKLISIQESPYHGLNFCVGTVAEMLQNPAEEIEEVIQFFGERKKIFNVHLRNIRGRRDDFQEVYLDNGDLNPFRILQVLQRNQYPYLIMPDHVPTHPDDPDRKQAFAFSFGYTRALLDVLKSTPRVEQR